MILKGETMLKNKSIDYIFGIKKIDRELGGINASKKLSHEHIAFEIGNTVINNSHILKDWFKHYPE